MKLSDKSYEELVFPVFPWALDFTRKIYEFGKFRRLLFRLIVGKYAFREFIGMATRCEQTNGGVWFGYGLEKCDYHKEKVGWDSPRERTET